MEQTNRAIQDIFFRCPSTGVLLVLRVLHTAADTTAMNIHTATLLAHVPILFTSSTHTRNAYIRYPIDWHSRQKDDRFQIVCRSHTEYLGTSGK